MTCMCAAHLPWWLCVLRANQGRAMGLGQSMQSLARVIVPGVYGLLCTILVLPRGGVCVMGSFTFTMLVGVVLVLVLAQSMLT